MKNLTLCILALTMSLGYAQRKPKIKGNKDVVEVSYSLPEFNALELNDDLDITLVKSSAIGYDLIADDNLIDILKFEVVDGTLVISSFYKITSKKKLEITVQYNQLEALTIREGKVEMKGMASAQHFSVNMFGSAKAEVNADADVVTLKMEGNSSGNFNFDADSLNIDLRDRVDTRIYTTSGIAKVQMLKNSGATLEGTSDTLMLELKGNPNLKAQKLEAAVVQADLDETPTVRLNAYREFELYSRGSSKTYLYGNPKITIHEFLDTSELLKRRD